MADVLGIYYGVDEPTLLLMLTDVLATMQAARSGNRFESANFAHKGFVKSNLTYDQLALELLEINAALRKIDPTTYGTQPTMLTVAFNGAYHALS